jgi:hypothetical protein
MVAAVCLVSSAQAQDSAVAATSHGDVAASSVFSTPGARVYVVAPEQSDDIPAAIERSVEHMNFIIRPIARHRLRVTNPLPQHLQLDIAPDTITVHLGDAPPAALPRDGSAVPWRSLGGDRCQISGALAGDTLVEHVISHGGQGETRYVMLDGGKRVREDVRITSSHLPKPVVYSVVFTKAE